MADRQAWDFTKIGDAAWLVLGLREGTDGRKCRVSLPDMALIDSVRITLGTLILLLC